MLLGVMCIAGNWISVVFWVCYIELLLLCPQVQFSRNAARDFENYKHYVLRRQCWNRDRNIKRLCTADIYRKRGRPFSLTKGLRSKRYTSLSVYIRSGNLHLHLGGGGITVEKICSAEWCVFEKELFRESTLFDEIVASNRTAWNL